MISQDLHQRFTFEKYCTKTEIIQALGTNLIEPIWKEIVDYRKRFLLSLPLADTFGNNFTITYIDPIQIKGGSVHEKIASYINGYEQLQDGSVAKYAFTHEMLKNSLQAVARYRKIDVSEITLTNIVENKPVDKTYDYLVRYHRALQVLGNSREEIGEEFLAKYYAILRGEDELTSFYRVSDIATSASKALIDRDYDKGVPARLIEEMMENLFNYANNNVVSPATRVAAIIFMFNYIKPFEDYNFELSILIAKRILGEEKSNTALIFVPIEAIINDSKLFNEVSNETKKSHDFTYFFLRNSNLLLEAIETSLDRIVQVGVHTLREEIMLGDDPKKVKEEFGVELPKKPVVEEFPKASFKAEEPLKEEPTSLEVALSEKEYKAKEIDLLESDPYLKKGQAHFYVRHCTKGKYYSIQQYKKAEGCVYETARTSMDNLAKQGYYRKEQIKNKFVYTPINKE